MTQRRMKRMFLALGLVLALGLPAQAQQRTGSVSGSVTDESGATLPGANVQLTGAGVNKFQITGNDGTFKFTEVPPGTHKLTVTMSGFGSGTQDVTVGADEVKANPFSLNVAVRGEEVVVTASRVESSLVNAPATMSVVSSETIQSSPAQNYGDLLRSVPGLNVVQTSARDVNMTSRQGTSTLSNSQLALLDGRSIYLDFFGLILWDFVPSNPMDIKQIEVVRGPASAVWGANALTGVINIITKTPRESPGGSVTFTGTTFDRDAGTLAGKDSGTAYGVSGSYAGAPNDTWSYRLAAGYYNSDPLARPSGTVPVGRHPLDSNLVTGGGVYPGFDNTGTSQPKVDLRVDQDLTNGGRVTYNAGFSGTEGIVHTGIGPFDLQSGSYLGFGRVGYTQGGFKASAFVNALDGDAPNLLARDATGQRINLIFETKTFDLEGGYTHIVAGKHILSYGGNARRNQFDISIAPRSEDRTELGAYFQDEIFFDKFRFALGGRVDKFGNLEDPVFSPRLSAMFKPAPAHSFKASFNRAFRSPSTINNFLDVTIVQPVDLRPVVAAVNAGLPPQLRPIVTNALSPASVGGLFPLFVRAVGNESLKEESLTAYEVAYTGTFAGKTTVGIAYYINDTDDNINFITSPRDPAAYYSHTNPPPGFSNLGPLAPTLIPALLAPGRPLAGRLPSTFTYLNIGKIRNKGLELSLEHTFTRAVNGYANYSWQGDPEPRDPVGNPNRYPTEEIGVPPQHRVNAGVSFSNDRFLGSAGVNYASEAFWTDVLTTSLHGQTDAYTMLNASFGMKFADGKVTASVKGTNLTNDTIQQHIFGDLLKRSLTGELRFRF
jgi:outer membrane receptor for ferrienterochelin and colicins